MNPFLYKRLPFPIQVDAYQATMMEQIPPGMQNFQCSQLVHRKPLFEGEYRLVQAGLQLFTDWIKEVRIIQDDIQYADEFFSTFRASLKGSPFPWPKKMFQTIVDKHDGKLPIVITGLPDGKAHFVGEPCVQVWTDVPGMGELVGYIESELLPYIWQSTVVATRGRKIKEKFINLYRECYPSKTDDELHTMVSYKFHDFGRRGAANSFVTGLAHLMNWGGTDTCDSSYYALKYMNNGVPFGSCSIPAMAHRTVTPWISETTAYDNMIDVYGDDIHAIVADSYDFANGAKYLASKADLIKEKGGVLVVRPDSGDPVQCVITGLKELEKTFGTTTQEVGLKVISGAAVIQGDGITMEDIFDRILPKVIKEGFCPSNVAFGCGQGNHKCNRSDIESAYKTCLVENAEDKDNVRKISVMKGSNSQFKRSYPCAVSYDTNSSPRINYIYPEELIAGETGDYEVYYDGRPNPLQTRQKDYQEFTKIQERTYTSWNDLKDKNVTDIASDILEMQDAYMLSVTKQIQNTLAIL